MKLESFISVKTLGLVALIFFSGSNYLSLRFTERVEVEGILYNYEGPWQRIRGGKSELFLKLYYRYSLRGDDYQTKSEVSLNDRDEAEKQLEALRSCKFFVDANDPKRLVSPTDEGWQLYFAILFLSILFLTIRVVSSLDQGADILAYE